MAVEIFNLITSAFFFLHKLTVIPSNNNQLMQSYLTASGCAMESLQLKKLLVSKGIWIRHLVLSLVSNYDYKSHISHVPLAK